MQIEMILSYSVFPALVIAILVQPSRPPTRSVGVAMLFVRKFQEFGSLDHFKCRLDRRRGTSSSSS